MIYVQKNVVQITIDRPKLKRLCHVLYFTQPRSISNMRYSADFFARFAPDF